MWRFPQAWSTADWHRSAEVGEATLVAQARSHGADHAEYSPDNSATKPRVIDQDLAKCLGNTKRPPLALFLVRLQPAESVSV